MVLAESVQLAGTVAVTVNVVVTVPRMGTLTLTVIVSVYVPGTTVCPAAAWGYIWSVWALPVPTPDSVSDVLPQLAVREEFWNI
jgi:hypothetical protein